MNTDVRGWRIALVAAPLVNADSKMGFPDVLDSLTRHGYGLLQLPPAGKFDLLLAVTADQVAEYAHHGYAVVAIGIDGEPGGALHWRSLASLIKKRGSPLPPRHLLKAGGLEEKQRLDDFLKDYDLPEEEQRRWRS